MYWTSLRNVGWHKFYLSMENSLCDDYITEKFFTILQEYDTVKWIQVHNWPLLCRCLGEIMQRNFMQTAFPPYHNCHILTSAHQLCCKSCAIHLHNSSRFVDAFLNWQSALERVWLWWWWVWTKCAPSVPPSTTAARSSVTNRGKN